MGSHARPFRGDAVRQTAASVVREQRIWRLITRQTPAQQRTKVLWRWTAERKRTKSHALKSKSGTPLRFGAGQFVLTRVPSAATIFMSHLSNTRLTLRTTTTILV